MWYRCDHTHWNSTALPRHSLRWWYIVPRRFPRLRCRWGDREREGCGREWLSGLYTCDHTHWNSTFCRLDSYHPLDTPQSRCQSHHWRQGDRSETGWLERETEGEREREGEREGEGERGTERERERAREREREREREKVHTAAQFGIDKV